VDTTPAPLNRSPDESSVGADCGQPSPLLLSEPDESPEIVPLELLPTGTRKALNALVPVEGRAAAFIWWRFVIQKAEDRLKRSQDRGPRPAWADCP
jgi:hypothetical protein